MSGIGIVPGIGTVPGIWLWMIGIVPVIGIASVIGVASVIGIGIASIDPLQLGGSLTFEHLRELTLVACRAVAQFCVVVPTRDPHSAILLQHHAVAKARCHRPGACVPHRGNYKEIKCKTYLDTTLNI